MDHGKFAALRVDFRHSVEKGAGARLVFQTTKESRNILFNLEKASFIYQSRHQYSSLAIYAAN